MTKYKIGEILKHAEGAVSVRQVLMRIGIRSGGHKKIRDAVKEAIKNNASFLGSSHNKRKACVKLNNDEYFTDIGVKRTSHAVRNNLFKRGLKNKQCENCGLSEWLDKPIPLEVHHRDGRKLNNQINNLQILCPNCHALTDTYKTKNRKNAPMM